MGEYREVDAVAAEADDITPIELYIEEMRADAEPWRGIAFEIRFEMLDPNMGYVAVHPCCGAVRLANGHCPDGDCPGDFSLCPAPTSEMAKLYDPNLKVDLLVGGPKGAGAGCCWRLRMLSAGDPGYVEERV